MNCQEFLCCLEAMPLRERTAEQMQDLHQHAQQCPSCAERLLTTSKVEHQLSHLAFISPPADLSANVMRRLQAVPSAPPEWARSRARGLFGWVAGPIAALITVPVCLYQAGLMASLKHLLVPHVSPPAVFSQRLFVAVEPGQWILGLGALLVGVAILAQREEQLGLEKGYWRCQRL